MRLGIVTPVVHAAARRPCGVGGARGIARSRAVVGEAERLGYDFCTCSEHVAVPVDVAAVRGATYWDPLSTFGYLARAHRAHPLRHVRARPRLPPSPRDREALRHAGPGQRRPAGPRGRRWLPGGRVRAARRRVRGPRRDGRRRDAAPCRAALSQTEPEYDGEYFTFGGFVVDPAAVQARVPIWVGGRTGRSLRRAVELGDGWAPFGLKTAQLRTALDRARDTGAWAARTAPLDVIVQNDRPLDPSAEPDRVAEQLAPVRVDRCDRARGPLRPPLGGALLRAARRARRARGLVTSRRSPRPRSPGAARSSHSCSRRGTRALRRRGAPIRSGRCRVGCGPPPRRRR